MLDNKKVVKVFNYFGSLEKVKCFIEDDCIQFAVSVSNSYQLFGSISEGDKRISLTISDYSKIETAWDYHNKDKIISYYEVISFNGSEFDFECFLQRIKFTLAQIKKLERKG